MFKVSLNTVARGHGAQRQRLRVSRSSGSARFGTGGWLASGLVARRSAGVSAGVSAAGGTSWRRAVRQVRRLQPVRQTAGRLIASGYMAARWQRSACASIALRGSAADASAAGDFTAGAGGRLGLAGSLAAPGRRRLGGRQLVSRMAGGSMVKRDADGQIGMAGHSGGRHGELGA
jgi:hypothetical protein